MNENVQEFLKNEYFEIKNHLKNLYSNIFKPTETYIWFFDEGAYAFEIANGKILKEIFFPQEFLSERKEIITLLSDNFFTGNNIYLIGNDNSIKLDINKYPILTDEELKDTLNWENYVQSDEHRTAINTYRIKNYNYEENAMFVYVASCTKEDFLPIVKEAQKQNKYIQGIIPVTEICTSYGDGFTIFYQNGKNLKLLYGHSETKKRNFKIDELETEYFKNKKIILLRTSTTTKEDVEEVLKMFGENVISDTTEENVKTLIKNFTKHTMCLKTTTGKRFFNISKEKFILRALQTLCIISLISLIFTSALFFSEYFKLSVERNRSKNLLSIEERKTKYDEKLASINKKYENIKKLQAEKTYEVPFLVNLAESVPNGVTLSEIEIQDSTINIKGTSNDRACLLKFEKNLKTNFKNTNLQKSETKSNLIEFNFVCSDEDNNHE